MYNVFQYAQHAVEIMHRIGIGESHYPIAGVRQIGGLSFILRQ